MTAHELDALAVLDDAAMGHDDMPLHIVRRGDYPVALCGYRVTDEFDPKRTDTAGRDRCPDCLRVARDRGLSL